MKNFSFVNWFTIVVFGSIFLFTSCGDFFEGDIENKEVSVLAPIDGYSSPTQTVTFWWEMLNGATHYNIQIVSSSFQNIQKVWADTIIEGVHLVLLLQPGEYQWRIKGFNSAYSTGYIVRSFSVEDNPDLSQQDVVLKYPPNNFFTNNSKISFNWFELSAAETYVFSLRTVSGDAIVVPFETAFTQVVFPDDFDVEDLSNGEYQWSVFAKNNFSNSTTSSRVFTVDRVNPAMPVQLLPANNDTLISGNITFTWERPGESLAPIFDSLFVQTLDGSYKTSRRVNNPSSSINLNAGKFIWRVQSFDLAGNASEPSDYRSLTIE